jgi:uncharacterized protein (TIRG00374 family)
VNRQRIATLGLATVVATFLVINRHDIPTTWRVLRDASPPWIALGGLLSVVLMLQYVWARRAGLVAVGVDFPVTALVRAGAVAHSLNIVTKSGGMAGLRAYRREAVRIGESPSRVTGGYVLVVIAGDVAFAMLLLAALVVLVLDGRFTVVDAIAALVFAGYFALVVTALIAASRSRTAVRRMYAVPEQIRGRVLRLIRRPHTPHQAHEAADELFDAVQIVRSRPVALAPALAGGLAIEVVSVSIVWVALRAFGVHTGLTVPLVGYAVSTMFSIVGVLPSGLGFAEASLGAVLVSYSVAAPVAAAAVITERAFEVWIPLAIGALVAVLPVRSSTR